jgi:hypothetical protein
MPKIKPFNAGYFSIHNAVFDVMMPTLSPNAFKVLCVAIRQTLGWRRERQQISYAQFIALSGIKSTATVRAAIEECLAHHYLSRVECGVAENFNRPTYTYRLNTDLELDAPGESYPQSYPQADALPDTALKNEADAALNFEAESATDEFPALKNEADAALKNEATALKNEAGPALNFKHTTIHKEHHHDDDAGSSPLSAAQQRAAQALQACGVSALVAGKLAGQRAPDLIAAWITHVSTRSGLKSPAAFLVAVLKRGDPPPALELAVDDPRCYITGAYADIIQH